MAIRYRLILLTMLVLPVAVAQAQEPTPQPGTMLWRVPMGGQLWAPLRHHSGVLFFGCDDMNFYAFEVATKEIKWTFKTEGIIRSAANITDGIVVFASDDGFLYALDAGSGEQRWRFNLGSADIPRRLPASGPPYDYDYLHSSPVYHEGRIYVGSANGSLYAIDHKTGDEQWHFQTRQRIRSTPVVDQETVYVGSWDGTLYAVSAQSGKEVWHFDSGGFIQSSPALGDGTIFIASRSANVFALDAQTGQEKWTYHHEDGSWFESSPVFHEGVVYIGSSDALKLWAFDAQTGQVRWQFNTGGWSWSTPRVAHGVVYIGGISAYPYYVEGVDLEPGYYAVDQKSGKMIWRMTPEAVEGYLTGGVFSSAEIVEEIVYVGGIDGYLYAFKE